MAMGRVWAGTTLFCPNPYPQKLPIPTHFKTHGHKLTPIPIPIGYPIPNGYPMGTVYSIYMLRNYRNESKIQVMIGDQFSIDVASCDGPIRGGKGVQ